MTKDSPQSETTFNPQIIEVLRSACASPDTRDAAINDPRALLSRHGIELADKDEIRVYTRTTVRKRRRLLDYFIPPKYGGDVAAPVSARGSRDLGDLLPLSARLEQQWRDYHGGCSFPTVPYKTKRKVYECLVWGVFLTGKEWVEGTPGESYGHLVYSSQSFCLLSREKEEEFIECLPYYSVPQP